MLKSFAILPSTATLATLASLLRLSSSPGLSFAHYPVSYALTYPISSCGVRSKRTRNRAVASLPAYLSAISKFWQPHTVFLCHNLRSRTLPSEMM
jgi:hypothetical protein